MTPVYPLLLAGIFRVFGLYSFESFVVAVALNIIFVVLTCIPLFYATKYVGGTSAAIGATWLWAVFPNAILIPVQSLWEASLSALLVATILWASFRLCRSSSLPAYCMYGLLWGFTLLTNPAIGAGLFILFVWIAWRIHAQHRGLLKLTAAGIVTVLCCLPWTIRNYEAFHTIVPLRSVGGLALWLGNSEYAQPGWHGQGHPIDDSLERARYISMGEVAYMHDKLELAITYMKEHPAREMRLIGRRFLALWCGGTSHPIADFLSIHSVQFRLILLFNIAVALGTLAGLIILFRDKDPYLVPLATFPLLFPITYYLTMAIPRYRLPIDPILTGLSAVACSRLLRHNKNDYPPEKLRMAVPSSRYTLEDQQRMSVAKNYFAWQSRAMVGELGARVLEIGCGIGNITQTLLDRELVIALDSDSNCVRHLQQRLGQRANLHTMVCDICCDEFLSMGRFGADSCAAVNVLEHIEDDRKALARMAAVLRPGGVIVLIVPAFSFLFGPADRNLGHYRRYNPRAIRDLAESVNVRVRKIRFMNFVGFFGWWMNARLFKREAQSKYQIQIFDRWIVPVLSRIEDRVPPPLGQSLLAVLQVP